MSEPEKLKDVPKPRAEQQKEPSAPKTSQSAFDKVLEQQKVLQQSPLLQGKVSEQESKEFRVREVVQRQEQKKERGKKDDKEETRSKDKAKQKDKGLETATREAVVRGGEKKGFGGGSFGGGQGSGFSGGGLLKKQVIDKKLVDARSLVNEFGKNAFAGKLEQVGKTSLNQREMQNIVNCIVQAIHLGKNGVGEKELRLILKEEIFSGLRLRFTSRHGKVLVQFDTANRKLKDLFTLEASKIKTALEEKGIAVVEIKVT